MMFKQPKVIETIVCCVCCVCVCVSESRISTEIKETREGKLSSVDARLIVFIQNVAVGIYAPNGSSWMLLLAVACGICC